MDQRNVHTQSSNYVGLFNSQHLSVEDENFPYESFHSSVNLGGSENPPFSTQQSEESPVGTPVSRPLPGGNRRKWKPADDEVLISAWLNTSKDGVVGNDQKSNTFWKRVADYYASSPHGKEDGELREPLHCKKRWHRINEQVNKFCGAYATAERQIASGESDTDVLKKAHSIFFADYSSKFTLEHAWCLLRFEQKWQSLNTPRATSKRKTADNTSESDTITIPDNEPRPEGSKASKLKKNNAQGKTVAEYATIWEMRKEELVSKERLSKLAILDTLLAKTQPLTEAEELVKNKLIAEYF